MTLKAGGGQDEVDLRQHSIIFVPHVGPLCVGGGGLADNSGATVESIDGDQLMSKHT